ncbi:BREX system ATP-binding domain-containing protein [Amycolatopsis sp. NPDC059657]|uniref:BREX system ATP-binding domain-containing protein n=1 Tax=Amycolatopsis sp. NPDC059657 TaxID=3346899 RepID=UPI003670D377
MRTEANSESPYGGPSVPKRPAGAPRFGRDDEFKALATMYDGVARGRATSAVLVGEFGMGKTTLLGALSEYASRTAFAVVVAKGSGLETHLSGGVTRQLSDGLTRALGRAPLKSPLEERPRTEHDQTAALEGFLQLVREVAGRGPLLLAVDDIHLADAWSMRCLAYIRYRVAEYPVLIVLTSILGQTLTGEVSLLELAGCSPAIIKLTGLGVEETGRLIAAKSMIFTGTAADCREATGGNPFLLNNLLTRLAPGADVHTVGSPSVGEVLRARLRVYPAAAQLVRAVAILGEDATFDRIATLAGVDERVALEGVDTLVRLRLLTNTGLPAFTYSFVRHSVLQDIPLATRAVSHAKAAELLAEADVPHKRVAAHLLEAHTVSTPWAIDILRNTAWAAVFEGEEDLAAQCLKRALAERMSPGKRVATTLQLAHAEYRINPDTAMARVREAVGHIDTHRVATHTAMMMILCLCSGADNQLAVSAASLIAARVSSGSPEATWPLHCMIYLAETGNSLNPAPLFSEDWTPGPDADPELRRTHAALLALDVLRRGKSADEAVRHLSDALSGDNGQLFEQPYFFTLVTATLADEPALTDRLCRVLDSTDDPFDYHLRKGSMAALARGIALQSEGKLLRASVYYESLLRLFDERRATSACPIAVLAVAHLAEVYTDLGRPDEAEALLAGIDFDGTKRLFQHNYLLYARGKLRVACGDTQAGLEDLLDCGRRLERHGLAFPAFAAWRPLAVRAALILDRTELAAALADADTVAADRWDTPRTRGSAMAALALTREDEEAERLLHKATELLEASPARLQLATTLAELGAARARRGHTEQAVADLQRAVELSTQCGSLPLTRRANEELHAIQMTTKDTAHGLTRQEGRIAMMAARGLTNREIAETLHLTRRTVELHLSGAYRKLGITGRAELAAALTA